MAMACFHADTNDSAVSRPTVILSDLHLGRPGRGPRDAAAFRPLWQNAERLILNGDVAEIHHPDCWSRAARTLLALQDACEQDGVELVLLSGNHDPFLSDRRRLSLAENRILITHGDAMHPAVAPWSPAAARMRAAHEAALQSVPADEQHDLDIMLAASQHASFAEWNGPGARSADDPHATPNPDPSPIRFLLSRPWVGFQILSFWRRFPSLAAGFLAAYAPDARFVVTGHTHRPGAWTIGSRVVINTGSFVLPHRPHAVLVHDDSIALHRIRIDGDHYRMIDAPRQQWSLERRARGRHDHADAGAANTPSPAGRISDETRRAG